VLGGYLVGFFGGLFAAVGGVCHLWVFFFFFLCVFFIFVCGMGVDFLRGCCVARSGGVFFVVVCSIIVFFVGLGSWFGFFVWFFFLDGGFVFCVFFCVGGCLVVVFRVLVVCV